MMSRHVALPALLLVLLLVLLASGCNLFGGETSAPVSRPAPLVRLPTPTPGPPPTPRPTPTAAPVVRAPSPTPAPSPASGLSIPAANDPLPSWPASRLPKPPPPPPGTRQSATGKVTVGQTVTVASTEVSLAGGQIEYTRSGDPLTGLKVTVPANAYPDKRTFKVSYAPVTGVTFKDLRAASPLITVDNGGGYSGEMMKMTVPVKLAPGEFAMGFLYDDKTGKLEGLPLLAASASSVTVGTYHFSNIFISVIESKLLKKDIDSGFRPGIDDWQFVNRGSYIAPGGHCSGQALTALWYYVAQPDGKDLTLYDRYDNNRLAPATPGIWEDDSYGYRFASVIQADTKWDSFANDFFLTTLRGIDDELTFKAFAYAMQFTGEPQEVAIFSNKGGGHAMIVYRIKDNQLYIADPNYPGDNDRRIEFVNGKFKPYNSGANKKEIDAGNGKPYETILYIAKTAIVDWNLIARRWAEVKNGAIGNDRFPKYTLAYADKDGEAQPLIDGVVISVNPVLLAPREAGFGRVVYRDGQKLNWDASGRYTLVPGENKLGFAMYGKVGKDWEYVDFRYVTVRYESGAPKPTPTATPAPTRARPGWVLKNTETRVEKRPEGFQGRYGFQVSGGLTATGSAKQEDFCSGKKTEVSYQSSHSFSAAPPARLTPGQTVPVTATVSAKTTGGCSEYSGTVSTGILLRLTTQNDTPYGSVDVSYNTTKQPSPPPKSQALNWLVPNGSRGFEMVVTYFASTPGGSGGTAYTYAWQE